MWVIKPLISYIINLRLEINSKLVNIMKTLKRNLQKKLSYI